MSQKCPQDLELHRPAELAPAVLRPRRELVVISSRPGSPRARREEITTPAAPPPISEWCRVRAEPVHFHPSPLRASIALWR